MILSSIRGLLNALLPGEVPVFLPIIANACASGANSIGHAWDLIRRGHAERAFAGGYDAINAQFNLDNDGGGDGTRVR